MCGLLTKTQKAIIEDLEKKGIDTSLLRTQFQVVEVLLTDVFMADLEKLLDIAKKYDGFIRFYAEDDKVVCRFHDYKVIEQ